jgi:hypothetical protein
MQTVEEIKAQNLIPPPPHTLVVADQIITRGVEVAGIGTEGKAVANVGCDHLSELGQLLEGASQGGAAARGGLEQDDD